MENDSVLNTVRFVFAICFVLIPEILQGLPDVTEIFSVNDAYDVGSNNTDDYDEEYNSENETLQFEPLTRYRPG